MKLVLKISFCAFILFVCLWAPLISAQGSNQTTQTNLEIPFTNQAPIFTGIIPNQTWARNTNLLNSINLNDYFADNETINFSYTVVQNITITINRTNQGNFVSFYPDNNFTGIRNVTFNATDGFRTTNSNIVYLNVTTDSMPPQWSNPLKNRDDVYQNLFVTFYTDWVDNVMLKSYRFHIKENSTWTTSEEISLSGTEATTDYGLQIRASEGTRVLWYFSAKDTSDNENSTEIQNFTVLSSPVTYNPNRSSSSGGSRTAFTEALKKQLQQIRNFKVYPTKPFKIDTKQGQTNTISIKITNTGNQKLSMNVSLDRLDNFDTSLSEKSFDLDVEESKTVIIDIKAGRFLSPDIYGGSIIVSSGKEMVEIPVIIQVNKLLTKYALNLEIYEESKEVRPDELVLANLTLTNLEDVSESVVDLYYAIRDYNGLIISFKNESFVFNKKTHNTNISLPLTPDAQVGEYVLYARTIIDKEVVLASDTFEIGERFNLETFVKTNLLIIMIIVIILAIIVFIIKYRRNREKLRLLNLYVMIKELKSFLQEGKIDEAIESYVRIKRIYGEKISKISSKEDLKKEMEQFVIKTPLPPLKKVDIKDEKAEDKKTSKEEIKQEKPKNQIESNKEKDEKKNETKELTKT